MNCKSCKAILSETDKFCSICGGKIIKNRLTVKSISLELFETILCWDNRFFKTIKYLFVNPKEVIVSYFNGVRKKYMSPFGFFILTMTIYGIYMFFIKDTVKMFLVDNIALQTNTSSKSIQIQQKINNFMLNYSNIITFFFIPLSAFFSRIILKKYNFVEHVIIHIYINAQYILVTSIFNLVAYSLGGNFMIMSLITLIFLFGYYFYVFKNIFSISVLRLLWKSFLIILLIFTLFIITGVILGYLYKF